MPDLPGVASLLILDASHPNKPVYRDGTSSIPNPTIFLHAAGPPKAT